MNAIECQNLTRTFGKTRAVDDLNLIVPAGSVFALLGANGAGKSTTLKLLLNLIRPSSGRAKVLGCDTTELKKEMFRRIGYVTEDYALHDWMTLNQLLDYYRPFYPQWDWALERQLRAIFDLPGDRPLKKLSRGMKMKAVFLSVLPFRPELLVLDEPFSGLDPQVRDEFIEGLLEIVDADRLNTVIVSSHDISEVERLADWVGILADGKLVTAEPMAQLQGRFRRIEVVGAGVAGRVPGEVLPGWRQVARPAANVVQFIHSSYAEGRTEQELRTVFGDTASTVRPMSLREIFLAHVRPSGSKALLS